MKSTVLPFDFRSLATPVAGQDQKPRAGLERALGLVPTVARLAHASRLLRRDTRIGAADYRIVWRFRRAFHLLECEAPQLLPWFRLGLAARLRPRRGEQPTQALRRWLLAEGVAPRGWRLLVNAQPWAFEPLLARQEECHWPALVQWLKFHQALDRHTPLPVPLQLAILREHVAGLTDTVDMANGSWCKLPLEVLRLASRHFERHFDADEFHLVMEWVFRMQPRLQSTQLKAGWPYLVREARLWELRFQCSVSHSPTAWESALLASRYGEIEALALADAFALWQEGQQMRHCAAGMVVACILGQVRIFSLRHEGRSVATVMLRAEEGTWQLDAIKGYANRPVSAALTRIGEQLLQDYRQAREAA